MIFIHDESIDNPCCPIAWLTRSQHQDPIGPEASSPLETPDARAIAGRDFTKYSSCDMALQGVREARDTVREVVDRVEETGAAVRQAAIKAAPLRAPTGAPAAPPVISTAWVEPREQYLGVMAIVGLIEVSSRT